MFIVLYSTSKVLIKHYQYTNGWVLNHKKFTAKNKLLF